jgi:hypothetical protein
MLASVADALDANPGELERIGGGSEVHAQVEHLATLAQKDRVSSTPTILVGPTGGKLETVDLQSLGPESVIPAIDAALADTK